MSAKRREFDESERLLRVGEEVVVENRCYY